MKWVIVLRFRASRSIAHHRISSQVSPQKLRQCGQSATHDGMFSYSPAMFIAAMVIRNILLTILPHISQERLLNHHHNAANCLKSYFKIRRKKIQYVGNASQHITCDFDVSQEFWNVPPWVFSIASCGWAYK